jgi:hypothetical protein
MMAQRSADIISCAFRCDVTLFQSAKRPKRRDGLIGAKPTTVLLFASVTDSGDPSQSF